MIIDGKAISEKIINNLKKQKFPNKIFAAILVGNNSSSISFLRQKEKIANDIGIDFKIYNFSADKENEASLLEKISELSLLKEVGGVIIQLPLFDKFDAQPILNVIPREKDIDVLGKQALGYFYSNKNIVLPPAVGVLEEILNNLNYNLSDKVVAIIGRGDLVGKPIATWLINKVKTLYVLGRSSDLKKLKEADLVISGAGRAGLIKGDFLKEGSGVVDFGYDFIDNKIKGDLDLDNLDKLSFYTLTPGGTGPILVAKLFENFFKLNNAVESK